MNFIEFNLAWYRERLFYFESLEASSQINKELLQEAKIMHKFLEDIKDEDYSSTYNLFQEKMNATKRLEKFITENHDEIFLLEQKNTIYKQLSYSKNEVLLNEYLKSLFPTDEARSPSLPNDYVGLNKLQEILKFSYWIYQSIPQNTTVIFLLRDTLLPFLAFNCWNEDTSKSSIPLMIGRKYLSLFGDGNDIYNNISDCVFTALDDSAKTPSLFQDLSATYIGELSYKYPKLFEHTKSILSSIHASNICVIESGVHGTMPLFLKSCDARITEIKLFTTLPWFYKAWNTCYYTNEYENLRLFETLSCQDVLFTLSSMKGTNFNINEIENKDLKKEAMSELHQWDSMINSLKTNL